MLRVTLFHGHRRLFGGAASQVILPGVEGEMTVLDFHAPMVCTLTEGAVQVDDARFAVGGGIARVARNVVTIVAR